MSDGKPGRQSELHRVVGIRNNSEAGLDDYHIWPQGPVGHHHSCAGRWESFRKIGRSVDYFDISRHFRYGWSSGLLGGCLQDDDLTVCYHVRGKHGKPQSMVGHANTIIPQLTGELEYTVPHMIAILVAKWVADALEREGVYDLAQTVLGHPFLDLDHSIAIVQKANKPVEVLIPPKQTMKEITVDVPKDGLMSRKILDEKLDQLKRRGLLDAGLVLVQDGMLQGYLAEGELEFGLSTLGAAWETTPRVRLLGNAEEGEFDMSMFVDRTPLTICAKAPMEYAVEMFGKLGLRHLCVVEEGSGRLMGVSQAASIAKVIVLTVLAGYY